MDVKGLIETKTGKKIINIDSQARVWKSWWSGKVDGFHNYFIYNGKRTMEVQKKSLQIAKTTCEDWADLLANEKTQVILPDDNEKVITRIFRRNNFQELLNKGVESTFALGNGCFVLGVTNFGIGEETGSYIPTKETEVSIEFFDTFQMCPFNIEKGEITECAFISSTTNYTEVSCHLKEEDGSYKIINFKVNNDNVDASGIYDEYEIKTKNKWFFPYRPNINNNLYYNSELGISIFANAIDVLKAIDDIYDAFATEYVALRPKIFVSAEAYNIVPDPNGGDATPTPTFNPYDTVFYQLPNEGDELKIQAEVPQIRYDAFINGLNTQLNLLSKKVGFGTERYKFDKAGIVTATQIISENSDMARSLKKQENKLKQTLINMVWAIKEINNDFTNQDKFTEFEYTDININFDDSIIEDENAIRERDRLDVQAGLMTLAEYRVKHYGKTEEEAEKEQYEEFLDATIKRYDDALSQGEMTPKEFVIKTRGKEDAELLAYIEEHLKKDTGDVMGLFDEAVKNAPDDEETQEEKEPEDEEEK